MKSSQVIYELKIRGFNFADLEYDENTSLKEALVVAYKQNPDMVLDYLNKRGGNIITTDSFDSITSEQHKQAFTVAKIANADVLQKIFDKIKKGIEDGKTLADMKKYLSPEISPGRVKTIVETNIQTAYMNGRSAQQQQAAEVSDLKYLQWIHTKQDSEFERPEHRALHLKVFRYDDPFWQSNYPPYRGGEILYGCGCRVRSLTLKQVQAMGLRVENSSDLGYDFKPSSAGEEAFQTWEPDTSKYDEAIRILVEKELEQAPKVEEAFNKEDYKDLFDYSNIKGITRSYYDLLDYSTRMSLDTYTASGYLQINKYLRGEEALDSKTIEKINEIRYNDLNFEIPSNSILFRGEKYKILPDFIKNLKIGDMFNNKGFFSTSYDIKISDYFAGKLDDKIMLSPYIVLYNIYIKKGVNVGVGHFGESELILNNDSLFKVQNKKVEILNKTTIYYFDFEYIGNKNNDEFLKNKEEFLAQKEKDISDSIINKNISQYGIDKLPEYKHEVDYFMKNIKNLQDKIDKINSNILIETKPTKLAKLEKEKNSYLFEIKQDQSSMDNLLVLIKSIENAIK